MSTSSPLTPHSSHMPRDAKVYVAGHGGLVGSALVRRLERDGYSNLIVRTSAELDLRNQAAVAAFFAGEKPEYVFLAAAKVGGIYANNTYPAEFIHDNLAIQTNVIHHSYLNGVKRLLFLGSSCIYPKHCPQPMKEEYLLTGELEPTNEAYAIAKIAGIKMCQAYNRQYGTQYLAAMPTNLYGPGDNFDLMNSHVLPAMIRKFHLAKLASEGKWNEIEADEERWGTIPDDIRDAIGVRREVLGEKRTSSPLTPHSSPKVILWGSGAPRREFLHVDDLADACVFLMGLEEVNYTSLLMPHSSQEQSDPSLLTPHTSQGVVNIGSGEDQTISELAELVQQAVGYEGEVVWDDSKPDGTPQKLLDVARLRVLGWVPGTRLETGVQGAYGWHVRQISQ